MKKIITVILLLFVGASIVKLVLNANQSKEQGESTPPITEGAETVVYYFHGNVRCKTCNTIEAYTKKTLHSKFADQMKNGDMVMRVINMDESQNEHYVKDYQLTSSSVVVSRIKDGEQVKWKRLDEVWDFVHDESAFVFYIEEETNDLIEGVQ